MWKVAPVGWIYLGFTAQALEHFFVRIPPRGVGPDTHTRLLIHGDIDNVHPLFRPLIHQGGKPFVEGKAAGREVGGRGHADDRC